MTGGSGFGPASRHQDATFTRGRTSLGLAVMSGTGSLLALGAAGWATAAFADLAPLGSTVWYIAGLPAVIAVWFGLTSVYFARLWLADPTLMVGKAGLTLGWRGQTAHLPWSAIDSWRLVPSHAARWLMMGKASHRTIGETVLVVSPPEAAAELAGVSHRLRWSPRQEGRILAVPGQYEVPPREVAGALPDRLRARQTST